MSALATVMHVATSTDHDDVGGHHEREREGRDGPGGSGLGEDAERGRRAPRDGERPPEKRDAEDGAHAHGGEKGHEGPHGKEDGRHADEDEHALHESRPDQARSPFSGGELELRAAFERDERERERVD